MRSEAVSTLNACAAKGRRAAHLHRQLNNRPLSMLGLWIGCLPWSLWMWTSGGQKLRNHGGEHKRDAAGLDRAAPPAKRPSRNDPYERSGCIRSLMVSTLPTEGASVYARSTRLGDAMAGLVGGAARVVGRAAVPIANPKV
eukprot:5961846-Amphidinium_carterae.2